MQLKQLITENRAVSPVIGVILMVAITVILAAVIGTFVLGLGNQVSTTSPTVTLQFDYTDNATSDTLDIAHAGGDTVEASQLNVTVVNANSGNGDYGWTTLGGSPGDVSAGDSITMNASNTAGSNLDLNPATVRVIWTSQGGDTTATLGKFTGPNA